MADLMQDSVSTNELTDRGVKSEFSTPPIPQCWQVQELPKQLGSSRQQHFHLVQPTGTQLGIKPGFNSRKQFSPG